MLKVRAIPTLLWKQFGLVKGVGFEFLWPQIVPLVVLALAVFGVAIRRFQKKID